MISIMDKKKKLVLADRMYIFTLFTFLAGIYFFSEQIKIVTVIATMIMLFDFVVLYQKISFSNISIMCLWVLYIVWGCISLVFSNSVDGNNVLEFYVGIIIPLLMTSMYLHENLREHVIKMLTTFCFFVFGGCVLQTAFPDVLKAFNAYRMGSLKYSWFLEFLNHGYTVGFSFQTGVTAFYLAILVLIATNKLFSQYLNLKEKCFWMIVDFISAIYMFNTGKRVFIALAFLIIIFLSCLYYRNHILKILLGAMVLVSFLYVMVFYTPVGTVLINRMNSIDPTRGRATIYSSMINGIQENLFFGNGVTSTLNNLSHFQNAHNIYLQIIYETGIMGLLILLVVFLIPLVCSIRILNKQIKEKKDSTCISICCAIQLLFLGWGVTGNPLYDNYPLIVYMIVVGVVMSKIKEEIYGR